jgi:hypothetical protein
VPVFSACSTSCRRVIFVFFLSFAGAGPVSFCGGVSDCVAVVGEGDAAGAGAAAAGDVAGAGVAAVGDGDADGAGAAAAGSGDVAGDDVVADGEGSAGVGVDDGLAAGKALSVGAAGVVWVRPGLGGTSTDMIAASAAANFRRCCMGRSDTTTLKKGKSLVEISAA